LLKKTGTKAAPKTVKKSSAARSDGGLWIPNTTRPAWLDGSLPGDRGFDPLGLGKDPQALKWYQQAELIHGRTAMTAVAGILIPAILTKAGVLDVPAWYEAGKISKEASGDAFNGLVAVQFFLCHFVEVKRWQDYRKPKSQAEKGSFLGFEGAFEGTENAYPGGIFDPLGLARESAAKTEDLKLKEIKNGRLAMLAFIGFAAQYGATGKGPIDNLVDHLASPWTTTFADNGVSIPGL